VAGALTERDFVDKLERAGFEGISVVERQALSVDDVALYPLFTPDVLELMRTLISPERQRELAVAVVVTARLPLSA
jgi:arsenite methyltransferase